MKKQKIFLILLLNLALGALEYSVAQENNDFAHRFIEMKIRLDSLALFADSYPPNVEDSMTLVKVTAFFNSLSVDMESLSAEYPDSAEVKYSLGKLYRMGHNLDIKDSWKKAEKNLKKSISLNPDFPGSYFMLGLLYVNSDITLASKAESLFRKALKLSAENPDPYIFQGLTFAYYYQREYRDALLAIEEFLKLKPDDELGVSLRNMILNKLGQ